MIAASLKWSRHNLFAKPLDAVLSLIVIPVCLWTAYTIAEWALRSAQWDIIPESLRVLMIGIYPPDQIWRSWTAVAIIGALLGSALGCVFRFRRAHAVALAAMLFVVAAIMLPFGAFTVAALAGVVLLSAGAWLLYSYVPQTRRLLVPMWLAGLVAMLAVLAPPGVGLWGGLLLSVIITLVTSIVTLPLGILLAFGRRSRLSSVRVLCTAYIEVMRSVPLILIVYWVWITVPVLAPQHNVSDVARGMVGFVLFYAAYVAEYVRSGLQNVPRGQTEAARSLGMSELDVNRYIVLPQAIRVAVPPLVGNVLDIFNCAALVFIIGLTDFLRAGQMILANPQYSDRTYEIYSFLFLTYFLIGCLITFVARRLEAHLAKGSR